jgi:hypothetical protein
MIRMRLAALALAALPALPADAADSQPRVSFATGNWRGAAFFDGEAFTHCQIRLRQQDGTVVGLTMRSGGAMSLGLVRADWTMDPAADHSGVRFEIEGGFEKSYAGRVDPARRNEIWVAAGNDPALRRALGQGKVLTFVDVAGKRWPFSIEGGAIAVRKLTACVLLFSPN